MAKRYLLLISDGPIDVDPLDVDAPAGCRVYRGSIGPDVPRDDGDKLGDIAIGLEFGGDIPMPDDVIPARERGARGLIAAMLGRVDDDDEPDDTTDLDDGGSDAAPVAELPKWAGEPNTARVVIDRAAWESRRWMPGE